MAFGVSRDEAQLAHQILDVVVDEGDASVEFVEPARHGAGRPGAVAGRMVLRQAREQIVHPPGRFLQRRDHVGAEIGVSAWRSALRATRLNWLTRFLMSWRMKAMRRLNSSNRRASASAPCARASAR